MNGTQKKAKIESFLNRLIPGSWLVTWNEQSYHILSNPQAYNDTPPPSTAKLPLEISVSFLWAALKTQWEKT